MDATQGTPPASGPGELHQACACRNWAAGYFYLVLLLAAGVRIRLLNVPLERDEGEYAYIAQLLLKGIAPYTQAYTMKLPGTSLMYALFMSVFGQTTWGIHLGLLLTNLLTVLLLVFVVRRLQDTDTGYYAGIIYLLLSLSVPVNGAFAHATHFAALYVLAGFYLLLKCQAKGVNCFRLFMAGAMFGAAIVMKQHAFPLALFALLAVGADLHAQRLPSARIAKGLALLCLGLLVPYACVAATLYGLGVFSQFWFWTTEYSAQYVSYISLTNAVYILEKRTWTLIQAYPLFYMLVAAGGMAVFSRMISRRVAWLVLGYGLFSFLAVCPGFYFRGHYFVILLPALALLAGIACRYFSRLAAARGVGHIWLGIFSVIIAASVYLDREYLFRADPQKVLDIVYGEYARPFKISSEIAAFIHHNSLPEERIAVVGSEPQIHFYADRISATGYIYMYDLTKDQKFACRMQQQLIAEIELSRPPWLVFFNLDYSWGIKPNTLPMVFHWVKDYTGREYNLVAVLDVPNALKVEDFYQGLVFSATHPGRAVYIFRRKDLKREIVS